MFANGQDITLLHGALMSAANECSKFKDCNTDSSHQHPFQLKDKEGVVDIVSSTILKLTRDTTKVKNGIEFLKMQLHLNRRLHSVIFFVALRSNDITCAEANMFYESIPPTFPSMDWMFYLKLNYQCNWSEYFIECAKQLQPDILAVVIKSLLPLYEDIHLMHYTWHLSLQSIVWKFFHLDETSILDPEQEFTFDFPFEDTTAEKPPAEEKAVYFETKPRSKLLHAFVTILNRLLQSPKTEYTFAKVVLHFYKTVFKLALKHTEANIVAQSVEDGKSVEEKSGGKSVQEGSDGKNVEKDSDGKSVEKGSNGKSVQDGSDKKSVQEGSDGKSVQEGSGGKSVKDGKSVQVGSDGKSVEKGSDVKSVGDGSDKSGGAKSVKELNGKDCVKELNGCKNIKEHSEGESVKELFRMNPLMEKCFGKDPSSRSALAKFIKVPENCLLSHCYLTASWDICTSYLLWLVPLYWRQAEESLPSSCFLLQQLTSIPLEKTELFKFDLPGEPVGDELRLFKAIIRYDYPYANRATAALLINPNIRITPDFIKILKEHASKHVDVLLLPLIEAIVETDSPDIKKTFVNLLFDILSKASCDLYDIALQLIIALYKNQDDFKLPDSEDRLLQFTRKTMPFDEAKALLLPLFIQMPRATLRIVITQALIRGAEGMAIIPVLKHVPTLCINYNANCFPLLEELSRFFFGKDLQTHVEKNFVRLIESVMVVQTEKKILPVDKFVDFCILSFSENIRIDLALECLNASLRILTDKSALDMSTCSFFPLMISLTLLLNDCIKVGNGKRKELVLLAFSILGEDVHKNEEFREVFSNGNPLFMKHLSKLNKVVIVYLKPLFEKKTYEGIVDAFDGICETSWIHCCQSKDPELEFKKILYCLRTEYEYEELMSILFPLLSHFTMKEWIQSANFLKFYNEHFTPNEIFTSLPSLLPKSDPLLYSVVRTLLECYSILLKIPCDKQYLTSCFTNTVMSVLGEKSHPQLLMNVFIDTCHLISISKIDSLNFLSSFLINIKKSICMVCTDKTLQDNYLKLAQTTIKCLPDSEEKHSLLKKF